MHSTGSSFGERRRWLREWRSNPSRRLKAAISNLNLALGKLPFPAEELIAAGEIDAKTTKAASTAFDGFSPDDMAHVKAVMEDRYKCVKHLLKTLYSKDDLGTSRFNIQALAFVIQTSFTLGRLFVHPIKNRVRTTPATEKTKGRIPKWYAVADKVRADLARGSPRNNYAMAHNKTAKRNFLHPHINEALEKAGMKPKGQSAVRDYLAYVDRKRT